MIFPYNTNARIYHWPTVTVVMIGLNVIVFFGLSAHPEAIEPLTLQHGAGLRPLQWITSNFVHLQILHLAGNMLSLWVFGLVVEGKLGWRKTLMVFLGLGMGECAIEQTLMLWSSGGGSYGASAIVFGYMAISLVWAPENDIQFVFLTGFHSTEFDVKIKWMVVGLVLLELATFALGGLTIGSELLHLLGAAIGFGVGVWMFKKDMVDCEDWDLFSVWAGRHTMSPEEREEADASQPENRDRRRAEVKKHRETALEEIRRMVRSGEPELALLAHQRMSHELPGWALPRNDLRAIIDAFHKKRLWSESIPPMVEYLSQYTSHAAVMRVKLAGILVSEQKRPAQALKVLAKVDLVRLEASQRAIVQQLQAKAEALRTECPYEVADEDW
jgi:membrane associated rhomboid family serine protease